MQQLNTSTSIVDFLKAKGKPSDFASRQKLAEQFGIKNFSGSGSQNQELLRRLSAGEKPPTTATNLPDATPEDRPDTGDVSAGGTTTTAADVTPKQAIIDRLTKALSTRSEFDPVKRREELEKEIGFGEIRKTETRFQQERQKTLELLDNLQKDITTRTAGAGFNVSEPERRRIEAAERNPILEQLGITERGLSTVQEQAKTAREDILDRLGIEQDAANRPFEEVSAEIETRKMVEDLFKDEEAATSSIAEYNLAVEGGFDGSFLDYIREIESAKLLGKGTTGAASGTKAGSGVAGATGAVTPRDFMQVIRDSAGGKTPVADERKSLTKSFLVVDQIQALSGAVDREATGPIFGIIRSANPYDTKAQQIKAQLTSIVPNLARGVFGEVGVLTDQDVALYSQTLPNLRSTEAVRNAVLGLTLKTVQRSIENQLEVLALSGIDVSGFEDKYNRLVATIEGIESSLGINSASGAAPAAAAQSGGPDLSDLDFSL